MQYTSFPIHDHQTHMNTLLTAAPHIHPHATLAVGDACLVYQGLLVNSYCTSDLCRLPGLARPPSASCDRRTFGHSTMSDPADAWFPRPRTPPALSRHKDQRAHCASHTNTDATIPGAQLMQATRGATSVHSSCNLRMVRQRRTAAPFSPPDDDAWLDIHQRACTRSLSLIHI